MAKYDVLEELGHGGMATVYRARDRRLGRDVAVKVIHPHLRDSREVAHRFSVEAQAVAKLRHQNIVEVFDVSAEDEPEQYLVVELLRGRTLRKLLQIHGALPPEVAVAVAVELLAALAHAHAAGVVHRDIKPENVIIEHRGDPPSPTYETGVSSRPAGSGAPSVQPTSSEQPGERVSVKLMDFGIAKLLDAQGMTSTGQVLGSPAHMAPEQIEGGDVDGRADVFGLGVLLYECMVGHLPFEGNNPAQVLRRVLDGVYPDAERERPTVGKRWSTILDRALARHAEDRFEGAAAMRDALIEELGRLGIAVPRAELEAWADDPDAYVKRHEKRLIAQLCERASAARKRGEVLSAAADYNRALAYTPLDPTLLRIVASMQRADERRRLFRRAAPVAAGAVAMGVIAFFVTRALHSRRLHDEAPQPAVDPAALALAAPVAPPAGSGAPPTQSAGSTAAPVQAVPAPTKSAAVKQATRQIVLDPVQPAHIQMSVDDDSPVEVERGHAVTLDTGAHQLRFTCREFDQRPVCDPLTLNIAAGEGNQTVAVKVNVKPATLTIEGDPSKSYRIEEYPKMHIVAGEKYQLPLTDGATRLVHVYEVESGAQVTVTIKAWRPEVAHFGSP